MIEIRIHGRGGQGVVAASEILAIAFFKDGKEAQAFPYFGVERSGAPIQSFVRISNEKIKTRQHIYEPDILVIQDDTLMDKNGTFIGLKKDGKLIINSKKTAEEIFLYLVNSGKISKDFKQKNIIVSDASKVALDIFGKNIVNTSMLGVLAKVPGLLSIDSAISAIKEKFSDKAKVIVDKNVLAIKKTYNS